MLAFNIVVKNKIDYPLLRIQRCDFKKFAWSDSE